MFEALLQSLPASDLHPLEDLEVFYIEFHLYTAITVILHKNDSIVKTFTIDFGKYLY